MGRGAVVELPDDIEVMPPGPELADVVSSVDRERLAPDDLLRVAQARVRLIAQLEAQLLADLHRVARTVPEQGALPRGVTRQQGKYPWAEVECAFALRWTHWRAAGQLVLADELIDRLPQVYAALAAGRIDVPKAGLIADAVAGLGDEPARAVAERVLPAVGELTTGQLRARLRRLVLAADPGAAVRRAAREVADRRVQAFAGDNGLASLAGYDLAPHRVAAVVERLDAIARAAKSAGDRRRADQLRADAFLDLLCGEGIAAGAPVSDGGLGLPGEPGGVELSDELRDAGRGTVPVERPVPWPDTPADPELLAAEDPPPLAACVPDPEPQVWAGRVGDPPEADRVPAGLVDDADRRWLRRFWLADFDRLPATRPGCPRCTTGGGGAALPGPRRGVIDVVAPLSMLMGLSQLPGELAGWGPVLAEVTRRVVAEQADTAQWRYSITDTFGEVIGHGRLSRRPAAGDVAFVRARDRRCRAPGCRRTARSCDVDHTRDWVHSKDSRRCNLACLCRLHHRFKHEAGAELLQLSNGTLAWRTPLGMHYKTHPDRHPHELEPAELLTVG